jgi:hypothetical protein
MKDCPTVFYDGTKHLGRHGTLIEVASAFGACAQDGSQDHHTIFLLCIFDYIPVSYVIYVTRQMIYNVNPFA